MTARKRRITILLLLVSLLTVSLWGTAQADDESRTASEQIERAWAMTHQANSFAYHSQIDQTIYPAVTLGNVGRTPQVETLAMAGDVDRSAEITNFTLWQNGSFDPQSGFELQLRGNRAYQRGVNGEWQEIENMTESLLPAGDPLGFLAGMKDVQAVGSESRDVAGATLFFDRYTFTFDGAAFADFVRVETERMMKAAGDLRPEMHLERSKVFAQTTGTGEIWLDQHGMPARLTLSLDLGEQETGERVEAQVTTDLSDYDLAGVIAAQTPFFDNPLMWADAHVLTPQLASATTNTAALVILITLIILSIPYWQRRRFYTGVVTAIIFSMVALPLLDAHSVNAFFEDQQERQAHFEAERESAENYHAAQSELTNPNWNPHQNPLESSSASQQFSMSATSNSATPQLRNSAILTDTTDSDSDGLLDIDEAIYKSCADQSTCPDLDATDTDGDGLSDGLEVHNLGTHPSLADTDNDVISDTLEVNGFEYNGQTWYLNPLESDTNKDGLIDSLECDVWSSISPSLDPNAICPDTDGDGTPDVFDEDNDGDGVHDRVDLSPFAKSDTFSDSNPMQLKIDNLALNQPAVVDFQFRPQNATLLTFHNHILDWPAGDTQGQIRRNNSTTFANTATTGLRSDAPNAGNGDMRFVPILELHIPFNGGHYANLPIKDGAPIQRTKTMTVGQWLDDSELAAHGITVVDAQDGSGDLVAFLPVVIQQNENDAGPAAFSARMLYWPEEGSNGIADWGVNHRVRLAWSVQMLVNECAVSGDPGSCSSTDQLTVAQRYVESWYVTGLTVTEHHGFDIALLHENPASDPDVTMDEQLWNLSWELSNTFLRGRDCDTMSNDLCQGDGVRDVRVENVNSWIDAWYPSDRYTQVETHSYPHAGHQGYVAQTVLPNLLNTAFQNHTAQNPTVMMLQETQQRAVSLEQGITLNGGVVSADLDPTTNAINTVVGINWAPYHYTNGKWESYALSSYLKTLVNNYESVPFFQPEDATNEVDITAADGKLIWLQMYYTLLTQGITQMVQTGDTSLFRQNPANAIPEAEFDPTATTLSRTGAAWVAYQWVLMFVKMNSMQQAYLFHFDRQGAKSYWYRLKQSMSQSYTYTRLPGKSWTAGEKADLLLEKKAWRMGNFALQGALVLMTVATVALAVTGFITGDTTVQQIGNYLGLVLGTIVLSIMLINFVQRVREMLRVAAIPSGVQGLVSRIKIVNQAYKTFKLGVATLIFSTIVSWAFFTFTVLSRNLATTSFEFQFALSLALAQTLVAIAVFVVELLLTALGLAPLLLILLLVDVILELFGVKGVLARFTEWLAQQLYQVETSIKNFEDAGRLSFTQNGMSLSDPSLGFRIGNSLLLTMTVGNKIRYDTKIPQDTHRQNTFAYTLTDLPTDGHDALALNQMNNQWQAVGSAELKMTQPLTIAPITITNAGVNKVPFSLLFINESFASFYQDCWFGFGDFLEEERCDETAFKDTLHLPFGDAFVFDVFPNSVAGIPHILPDKQIDFDGDGLIAVADGGTDPNDHSYDSDGDTLSDFYEQSIGTNPLAADTDNDGLSDAREKQLGTDPLNADTDGDQLSDGHELRGWLYAYQTNPIVTTRVWSDPFSADIDGDSLTDLEEYIFAQHPQVATDPSVLRTQLTFSGFVLDETQAPELLLQFEEAAGATAFANGSGAVKTASCGGNCPTVGAAGHFGSGVAFDGSDNPITIANHDSLNFASDDDFTVALWVNPATVQNNTTSGDNAILEKWSGVGGYPFMVRYLNQTSGTPGHVRVGRYDGNNFVALNSSQPLDDGNFHHIAFVKQGETLALYVDGVLDGTTTDTITGSTSNSSPLTIGRRGSGNIPFTGNVDEVVIFDRSLNAGEVGELVGGIYNPNDQIVAPGDPLAYGVTITNTNLVLNAAGNLVGSATYAEPSIAAPQMVLDFSAENTRVNRNFGLNSSLFCTTPQTCPDPDAADSNALAFDGVDDSLRLIYPVDFGRRNGQIQFRIKPDTYPTSGNVMTILDTVSTADGAPAAGDVDIWLDADGYIWIDHVGDNPISFHDNCNGNMIGCATHNGWTQPLRSSQPLAQGSWANIHILFSWNIDEQRWTHRLFRNGSLDSQLVATTAANTPTPHVGAGTIGSDHNAANHFDGGFDDLRYVKGAVDTNYAINYEFNDSGDSTLHTIAIDDKVTAVRKATCTGLQCPTFDTERGGSLSFDGTDDYLRTTPIDIAQQSFTLGAWVKRDQAGHAGWVISQGSDAPNDGLHFGFRNNDSFTCAFYTNDLDTIPYTDSDWHHWTCTYDHATRTRTLYRDGVQVAQDSNVNPYTGTGVMFIGSLAAGATSLQGHIDDVVVIDDVVDVAGVQALMQSGFPAITLDHDFIPFQVNAASSLTVQGHAQAVPQAIDSVQIFEQEAEAALLLPQAIPVTGGASEPNLLYYLPFDDVPGSTLIENVVPDDGAKGNDFPCTGSACPDAGLRGRVDRAAYFDGVSNRLSLNENLVPVNNSLTGFTIAGWVKASRGTVANVGPIELDIGRARFHSACYHVDGQGSSYIIEDLPFDMPHDQWVHLAATIDDASGTAYVYVNGVVVATRDSCIDDGNGWPDGGLHNRSPHPTFGNNHGTLANDPLAGYLDDVRVYTVALSSAEIGDLIHKVAPLMRFEFDEAADATTYADAVNPTLFGTPFFHTCTNVRLESAVVNSSHPETTHFAIRTEDNAEFGKWETAAYTTTAPLNAQQTLCDRQRLVVELYRGDLLVAFPNGDEFNIAELGGTTLTETITFNDNSLTLTYSIAADATRMSNPAPGTDGQIGNTALFNGEGHISIPAGTSPISTLTNDLTISAWIKPNAVLGEYGIMGVTFGNFLPSQGMQLLVRGGHLVFNPIDGSGTGELETSTAVIVPNLWQHVAVVFDASNDAHFYVNGLLVETVAGDRPMIANTLQNVLIGTSGQLHGYPATHIWQGQIDELSVYGRSFDANDVFATYLREVRWYRASDSRAVTIDATPPTVSLLSPAGHRPLAPTLLAVSATDNHRLALVQIGLKAPGESNFTWTYAPECQSPTSRQNNPFTTGAVWCPAFNPTVTGAYDVQFRAVDTVGNVTVSDVSQLIVENAAPTMTLDQNETLVQATAVPTDTVAWRIPLSGTISDPAVGGIAGSGVATQTVAIQLFDYDTQAPLGDKQTVSVNGATWTHDYLVVGEQPVGIYVVQGESADNVNNQAPFASIGELHLDTRAPVIDLYRNDGVGGLSAEWVGQFITQTVTLHGVASEFPQWGGALARFHFEESAPPYHNASDLTIGQHLTCTTCPTTVSNPATFGSALQFTHSTPAMGVMTDTAEIDNLQQFSLAFWINPAPGAGIHDGYPILNMGNGKLSLSVQNEALTFALNISGTVETLTTPASTVLVGRNNHVIASYDGTTMRVYHNGNEVASKTVSGTVVPGNGFTLGGTTTNSYQFWIDELAIHNRALLPLQINALAEQYPIGLQQTQIALVRNDLTGTRATDNWQPAAMTAGDAVAAWQYTLPTNLEGHYTIKARGSDANGNVGVGAVVWQDVIDMVAPRIVITETATTLHFTIDDFAIDEATIVHPCMTHELTYARYSLPNSTLDGLAYRVTGNCSKPPRSAETIQACDAVGHCTNQSNSVPTAVALSAMTTAHSVWQMVVLLLAGVWLSLVTMVLRRRS